MKETYYSRKKVRTHEDAFSRKRTPSITREHLLSQENTFYLVHEHEVLPLIPIALPVMHSLEKDFEFALAPQAFVRRRRHLLVDVGHL